MSGYLSVKMKRKDLEQVYDDFSDFSLSSPARKIRRLDAELPPIMEEEETIVGLSCEEPLVAPMEGPLLSSPAPNEERALVLYKPVNTLVLQSSSSSNLSFIMDTDLISSLKNQFVWPGCSSTVKQAEEEKASRESKECLEVVPWVPTQNYVGNLGTGDSSIGFEQSEQVAMGAEGADASSMEVEENNVNMFDGQQGFAAAGRDPTGGLQQQWQQPHCIAPQRPRNTSTPIMWSW